MKRYISGILCAIMCLSLFVVPAAAIDTSEEAVLTIQVFNTEEDYQNSLTCLNNVAEPQGIIDTVYAYCMVRKNGASDATCQLYVNWAGDVYISAIRFEELTVESTSILFHTIYGTFGSSTGYKAYYVPAATVGSVLIGELEIPTDVEQVRVGVDDMQAHLLTDDEWISVAAFDVKVNIKD